MLDVIRVFKLVRTASMLLDELESPGSVEPAEARAASMLIDELERLLELASQVANDASVAAELVDRFVLDVWLAVIAVFADVRALSILIEDPLRLVLES